MNGDEGWSERARLGRAIEKLPEPEKTVVMLYYHANLSEKKVAVVMDTSEQIVATLRQRALAALRKVI